MTFKVRILTLFPNSFPGPLGESLIGKGLKNNVWSIEVFNLRDFAKDKHRNVDDTPYGGGPGMIIKPDIIDLALQKLKGNISPKIFLTPRGKLFNQKKAIELSKNKGLDLICGHYEGIDERVIKFHQLEEVCIGNFVLSGGETAAIVLLDSVLRLLPSILGGQRSLDEESFTDLPLLEYPQYTKPKTWKNLKVPNVLLSGNHKKIYEWRYKKRLEDTKERRPDLLEKNKKV